MNLISEDYNENILNYFYDYYFETINLSENASYNYFKYVRGHINNVKKGYRWLKKYLPELFENKNKFKISTTIAMHDLSKFLLNKEFKAYKDHFYGTDEQKKNGQNDFSKAWNHHQKMNKHHWQYWVLVDGSGKTKAIDMPYENIIEMICDWWSFSWKSDNLYAIFDWYNKNKSNMILSANTRKDVEVILSKMKKKLDEMKKEKESSTINESVLDPLRKERCEVLFGKTQEQSPKLRPEIRKMILNILDKFIKDADLQNAKFTEVFIVGSSLGFQYRDDSDVDVDARINLDSSELKGKFSFIPKNIIIPGTEHPINIYLLTKDSPEYNFDKDAENAYDVLNDKWIKQSQLSNSSQIPFAYLSGISEFLMDGITLQLQRAERDIRELEKYIKIDPNEVAISEKEKDQAISNKINDLIIDKDSLRLAHTILFRLDQDGFSDKPISISIDYNYESRHFSMNNLIYKYIDSFKYYDKINEMVKEIDEKIKSAKEEIQKNTAEDTPEGMNKEEVQKEIKSNEQVKEEYSFDELKEILKKNGYEPSEKNANNLYLNLGKKYIIAENYIDEDDQELLESLASRTEKFINKKIYKMSGKWNENKATVIGFLLAGIVGAMIGRALALDRNQRLSYKEEELYSYVENDSSCQKILDDIKKELNNENPDKAKIKVYKKDFSTRLKELAKEIKESEKPVKPGIKLVGEQQ